MDNPIKVFASVSKPQQQKISSAIESNAGRLDVSFVKASELSAQIKKSKPDYLILEFDDELETQLDELTKKHPAVAIVVLLPKKDLERANEILLSGARAFIPVPFTNDEFTNTIYRLDELVARSHIRESDGMKDSADDISATIAVFSPRGGAGTTTVAVNLAIAIHQATKKSVLLVDAKNNFGHVDLMLNIKPENTIADLLPHMDHLEARLVNSVVGKHVSGIVTLLGPQSIEEGQSLTADHVFSIANIFKTEFSYIVVDCGNQLDEKSVTWMDISQAIFLVLNANLADLRDVRRFLSFSKTLNIPSERFFPVLNKTGVKGGLRDEEIQNALGTKIFGYIPQDETRVVRSMNRGVPVLIDEPRSPVSKAFSTIAQKLLIHLTSGRETAKSGRRDILATTSRLG